MKEKIEILIPNTEIEFGYSELMRRATFEIITPRLVENSTAKFTLSFEVDENYKEGVAWMAVTVDVQ